MDTHGGDKKKSSPYIPPTQAEDGWLNTDDYDFRFVHPLHKREARMIVSRKSVSTSNVSHLPKSGSLSCRLKSGSLGFNVKTGIAKLNGVEAQLNPKSREASVLYRLMTSEEGQATYEELLGGRGTSIDEKRKLTFVIRNLKEELGILPRKKAKNKNVIRNLKGLGYQLIMMAEPKHTRSTNKP